MRNLSCPHQLEAYHQSDLRHSAKVIEGIRQDACLNTAHETTIETEKTRIKKLAWDIALRLNLDGIHAWFPEALEETNSFVQGEVAKIAGYVRAISAIPTLHTRITNVDTENTKVILGVDSIRALGNIGTREAFNALMESRIRVGDNDIPQALPDAIAIATLLMEDCTHLKDRMLDDTLDLLTRKGLTAALEQVASERADLVEPFKEQIIFILSNANQLPPRMAGYLIGALGYLKADSTGADLLLHFAHGDEEVSTRALESLARWDMLNSQNDLLEALGLKAEGDTWTIGVPLDYRGTFITGLLYTKYPRKFSHAVVSILKEYEYIEAVQVMWLLQLMPTGSLTPDVEEALLKRIMDKIAERCVETEALDALAAACPERFAHEFLFDICVQWYTPAKEYIISCLHRIIGSEKASADVAETLRRFLSDSIPSVQREAARALSDQNADLLCQETERLMNSAFLRERECGIQAACWIKQEETFQSILMAARHDPEKTVRYAARVGLEDRRDRTLARLYLGYVLATKQNVLDVWHYGQALRDYGDDETAYHLEVAAKNPYFTPNKRDWMKWIAEGVHKRWEERERKRNE